MTPYTAEYRKLRRTIQQLLNVNAIDSMLPIQAAESTLSMLDIIKTPDQYYEHIRRYSTAVILASVFGQRGKEFESKNVQALYHAMEQFTAILEPGATPPVDVFPILKLLPEWIAGWKKQAGKVRMEQSNLYGSLLEDARKKMSLGGEHFFLQTVLREQKKSGLSDKQLPYIGGVFVSSSFLTGFVLVQSSPITAK